MNLLFCELPAAVPCQVVFTVGKKRFPSAVNRNRVKRMLRELYRKDKMPLYQKLEKMGVQLAISVIYTGKELPEFQTLEKQWQTGMKRLFVKLDEMQKAVSEYRPENKVESELVIEQKLEGMGGEQ